MDRLARGTRREALRLLGLGAGAALLAACQAAAPAPAPTGAASAAPTAAQPKPGGSLRVGVLGDLLGLDGHLTTGLDSLYRIFNPVSTLDEKLDIVPVLAETVELSPDARQIRLALRKGVQFHSGRELTSDDVVWNYTRLKDPKVNAIYANLVKPFASLETPDEYTVVITFDNPDPAVGDALQILNILDPVSFQQFGPNRPVGTGPFMFGEYVQGDHLTLKKNPNYWQPGRPYLDEIHFQIFTDPQAMVTQLEGGGLDLVNQPSLVDTVRLQKDPKYQVLINQNSGQYMAVLFNTSKAPTNNRLLRQAMNYAIDRQRIVESVWLGIERPLNLLWYPSSPAYDASKNNVYPFDLDKAKALLDQSGLAGSDLNLDFNYSSAIREHGLIGQIWQADLAKIGVTLTLKPTDPVAFATAERQVSYQGVAAGQGLFAQLHGGDVWTSPVYGPINNWAGYQDDTYTRLSLAVYTEVDPAKQKQAYAAWNDYALEQSAVTTISTVSPRAAMAPTVHGVTYNSNSGLDLSNAWLG
jgi:peptide/nickel transport system substrate-binding protein